ncbi:hypothetical protein B0A48_16846 [Cryoendolithus antarcticus]|uniref:Uncharacterized protein n=1 Tax=Cryoendolithus antarcticus TaxID=1507870 RepID=A0A1V8SD10_9PEZI|nr:hypothetical protein B0A48_16846 [Cryoendolithus antarcticus]
MTDLTLAVLEPGKISSHESSLPLWSVFTGPDLALPLIEASTPRDAQCEALKALLANPQTTELALEQQNVIYHEDHPRHVDARTRTVRVLPFSNLQRALNKAAVYNCPEAIRILLEFAVEECRLQAKDLVDRTLVIPVIKKGQDKIFKSLVTAYPPALSLNLGDRGLPLDFALDQDHLNIVTVLLEHGVDIRSTTKPFRRSRWSESRLFLGVDDYGTRLSELLIEQGFPIAGSGALHHAAEGGRTVAMRFLIERGARVNEFMPADGIQGNESERKLLASWTPMHAAASKRQLDAMALLRSSGAPDDILDAHSRTPQDVLNQSERTLDDLKSLPSIYASTRGIWEVLLGEDFALPLTQAALAEDVKSLQQLLADPKTIELALMEQHTIYSRDEPRADKPMPEGWSHVSAMPYTNLSRILTRAAINGHAEAVSLLLSFAKKKCKLRLSSLIDRMFVVPIVRARQTAVFDAVVTAYPETVRLNLGHWGYMLDLVVNFRNWDMVATVLEHGVDPNGLTKNRRPKGSYPSSWLCWAAGARGTRLMKVLVSKHNLPVNGSGALHRCAEFGTLDTMQFLLDHGADVDEILSEEGITSQKKALHASWTPMHFAASRGQVEARELLQNAGAKEDVKDVEDRTPGDLLISRDEEAGL